MSCGMAALLLPHVNPKASGCGTLKEVDECLYYPSAGLCWTTLSRTDDMMQVDRPVL